MKEPLVSVIVPVYNVENYLSDCVESIQNQTHHALEIILVDDGSPDSCPQLCDDYAQKDARIHVLHQKNQGLSAARNSGIRRCTGEYIAFVDSDDFIHRRYIEALLRPCLEQDCGAAIAQLQRVPAEAALADHFDGPISGALPAFVSGRESNLRLYTDRDWERTTTACIKLFRRELWADSLFPAVRLHEDEALIYRILYRAARVAYLDEKIYFYRKNPTSLMNTRFSEEKLTMLSILDDRLKFYREYRDMPLITRTQNRQYFTAVEYYQLMMRQEHPNQALLQLYQSYQRHLYLPLLCSDYPLKRKVFYTLALLSPQKFTRLYCERE